MNKTLRLYNCIERYLWNGLSAITYNLCRVGCAWLQKQLMFTLLLILLMFSCSVVLPLGQAADCKIIVWGIPVLRPHDWIAMSLVLLVMRTPLNNVKSKSLFLLLCAVILEISVSVKTYVPPKPLKYCVQVFCFSKSLAVPRSTCIPQMFVAIVPAGWQPQDSVFLLPWNRAKFTRSKHKICPPWNRN